MFVFSSEVDPASPLPAGACAAGPDRTDAGSLFRSHPPPAKMQTTSADVNHKANRGFKMINTSCSSRDQSEKQPRMRSMTSC